MKTNGYLLVIYAMLAFVTTAGVMMGDTFTWDGLFCWTLTFCFWFLMLIGAWEFPKRDVVCSNPRCKEECTGCL